MSRHQDATIHQCYDVWIINTFSCDVTGISATTVTMVDSMDCRCQATAIYRHQINHLQPLPAANQHQHTLYIVHEGYSWLSCSMSLLSNPLHIRVAASLRKHVQPPINKSSYITSLIKTLLALCPSPGRLLPLCVFISFQQTQIDLHWYLWLQANQTTDPGTFGRNTQVCSQTGNSPIQSKPICESLIIPLYRVRSQVGVQQIESQCYRRPIYRDAPVDALTLNSAALAAVLLFSNFN